MKLKIAIAISIAFLPYTEGLSQTTEVRLGIKGGMNIVAFHSPDVKNEFTSTGFHLGLYAGIPLTGNLSFQPELLYSTKGTTMDQNVGRYFTKADFDLAYVEAGGLLDVRFAKVMHLQGGIFLGVLTNAEINNETNNPESINLEQAMNQSDLNWFDPSLAVGVQGDLTRLNIGLRYQRSLLSIGDDITYQGETLSFPDLRNSVFQIYIGFRIL